jgi:hypothetical protein
VAGEWKPIETAPQGYLALFCDMNATEARDWAFVDWIAGAQFVADRHRNATHWMPLPEPPPRDSDGTATAAANGDLPVPQNCQARAKGIAQTDIPQTPSQDT